MMLRSSQIVIMTLSCIHMIIILSLGYPPYPSHIATALSLPKPLFPLAPFRGVTMSQEERGWEKRREKVEGRCAEGDEEEGGMGGVVHEGRAQGRLAGGPQHCPFLNYIYSSWAGCRYP